MQIPNSLQAFPHPALIAVTDNARALIFEVSDRTINLLQTLSADVHERETEHTFFDRDMHNKEHVREELFTNLAKTLHSLLQQKKIEHVALVAPEERMETLKEHLPMDVLKKVFSEVPKNLTGEDLLEIVGHVQEAAS